jgi:putative ABC transport system permease protein
VTLIRRLLALLRRRRLERELEGEVTHVLRNAARLIIVGLTVGLVGALALTRVMSTLLFQVSAIDPIAFTLAVVSMILVGSSPR